MRKGAMIFVLTASAFITYIILLNVALFFMSLNFNFAAATNNNVEGNGAVNIGVSDAVSVSVLRNRWYGQISESGSTEEHSSTLYLFGLVRFPLRANGTNLILFHIILICVVAIGAYGFYNRFKRKQFERGYF